MRKSQKALASLSLALLAGCVAPKEIKQEEPIPRFETVDELIDYLKSKGMAWDPTPEELDNCRAPMAPQEGYQNPQKRMLYWSALRNTNRISRISNYGR